MTGLSTTLVLHAALLTSGADAATYGDAYKAMQNEGKPMLVLVGADWCPACRVLKNTASQMRRQGKLANVAFAVVDYDRENRLATRMMRGQSVPQLILFEKTATGWRRTQLTGGQSETQVLGFVADARQFTPTLSGQARLAKEEQVTEKK